MYHPPLDANWGRSHSLGKLGWANKIADVFMAAQSFSAHGMALHLVKDRLQIKRISPLIARKRFALDGVGEITSLKGLGDFEAREALPDIREVFFKTPVEDDFVPSFSL